MRVLWFSLCLFGLMVGRPAFSQASSQDDKIFMMVLGDSVTLGVWADTTLGHPKPSFYGEVLGVQLHAALLALFKGERISDLSNAQRYTEVIDRNFGYITRKSWSGLIGSQPDSLPQLIQGETGRNVEVFTAAILAGCYQLADLLYAKVEGFFKAHPTHRDPDIVIVNFNAMDFIFATPEDQFAEHVRRLFYRLAARFPRATFVVTPLVDIVDVMTDSFDRVTLPGRFGLGSMTCAESYQKVGFGSVIDLDPSTAASDVEQLRETRARMQATIDGEIARWDNRSPDHEAYALFEGRVLRPQSIAPPGGSWAPYLAIDCIHPNKEGQKLLGYSVWQSLKGSYRLGR